jgi:hypothetical protein
MSRKAPLLPDLDDDEFTRRLRPLEAMVLRHPITPASHSDGPPGTRHSGFPDNRISGSPSDEMGTTLPSNIEISSGEGNGAKGASTAGGPQRLDANSPVAQALGPEPMINERREIRNAGPKERWTGLLDAAARLTNIERTRGPKRRFEYLIPERVGDALAEDAARQGKSATVRLLEVLRDAGYPVIAEDLIDLRRQRRR